MKPEDALRAWLDARPARPTPRWHEDDEQRMSQIAESYDYEDGTYRRLGPRRA